MLKAGNVERVLVFGILLIIGLILVVAIKGAKDLEGDRNSDGTANAKLRSEAAKPSDDAAKKEEAQRETVQRGAEGKGNLADSRRTGIDEERGVDEEMRRLLEESTRDWNKSRSELPEEEVRPDGKDPGRLSDPGRTGPGARTVEPGADPAGDPNGSRDPIGFDLEGSRIASGSRPGRLGSGEPGSLPGTKPKVGGSGAPGKSEPAPTPDPKVDVTPANKGAAGTWTYTVQSGDILGRIADKLYGTSKVWPEIAAANPDVDPDRLKVDTALQLPRAPMHLDVVGVSRGGAKKVARADPKVSGRATGSQKIKRFRRRVKRDTHEVKSGDTLMNIALGAYGTRSAYKMIVKANLDVLPDENKLIPGLVLQLPPN